MKNKFLFFFIIFPFVGLGLSSLLNIQFSAIAIFEILFFGYSVALFVFSKKNANQVKGFYVFCISFIYLAFSYLYSVVYKHANFLDFCMIFKTFIYFLFLPLIINVKVFDTKFILRFINIIYGIFILKYVIEIGLTGVGSRPSVYTENNFELMFLCSLYLVRLQLPAKNQFKVLIVLGAIVLLSLSRSGMLMYATIFLYAMNDRIKKYRVVFMAIGGTVIVSLVLFVFMSRLDSASIESIDRYQFVMFFLDETQKWKFYQFLVGAPRITELSRYTCSGLSYFEGLMSFSGNGSCYSVLLHSYLLRVVFDHGLIGLAVEICFTYQLLLLSGVNKKITWVVIVLFLLNGLSVSSFNSVFFPISMIFLMGTKYQNQSKYKFMQ